MSQPTIDPTAVVAEGAELGDDVEVGAFCVLGADIKIANQCRLHSHVVVTGRTSLGEGCEIFPFASIGHIPQDQKFQGEESQLVIGPHCTIREHVTMNPGTKGGGGVTRVGAHGLFMVGSHVAHDCQVGDRVILANNATLAGHCVIGDHVILGGLSAVHQFVRIGPHAFIGGMSGVENDVIPFGVAIGDRASLSGLNIVGLKRRGFSRDEIHSLRNAYRLLFSNEGTLKERLVDVEAMFADDAGVRQIIDFINERSDRALCMPKSS